MQFEGICLLFSVLALHTLTYCLCNKEQEEVLVVRVVSRVTPPPSQWRCQAYNQTHLQPDQIRQERGEIICQPSCWLLCPHIMWTHTIHVPMCVVMMIQVDTSHRQLLSLKHDRISTQKEDVGRDWCANYSAELQTVYWEILSSGVLPFQESTHNTSSFNSSSRVHLPSKESSL